MLKILTASLVGAALCVLWSAISWMGLQWHQTALRQFHDEAAVSAVLKPNVEDELKHRDEKGGVFILPGDALSGSPKVTPANALPPPKPSTARKPPDTSMFAFVVVLPGLHHTNFGINMAWIFARSFIACLILSLMLSGTFKLDYLQRVLFCALGGVFSGMVADVPLMIWFEMPLRYTLVNLADHLCEWSLAGLAIALFIEGREMWETIR